MDNFFINPCFHQKKTFL